MSFHLSDTTIPDCNLDDGASLDLFGWSCNQTIHPFEFPRIDVNLLPVIDGTLQAVSYRKDTLFLVNWEDQCFEMVCQCSECSEREPTCRERRPLYFLTNSDGCTYINIKSAQLYNSE